MLNMSQMSGNPNISSVETELASMAKILKPEVTRDVLVATNAISPESSDFNDLLASRLVKQIEVFGKPRACMFICPKFDARDMGNPARLLPH